MRDSAPPKYAGTLAKALAGTASPRAAIKAMCLNCTNYERLEVINCGVRDCPLHAYRPFVPGKARQTLQGAGLSASELEDVAMVTDTADAS